MIPKIHLLPFAFVFLAGSSFAQFMLKLNFINMDSVLNQRFEIRITDTDDDHEVARELVPNITAANFTMDFIALKTGHSYNVDFFVDMNANEQYDAPPVDRAWRLNMNNVTSDRVVNFTYNTNYMDVDWPKLESLSYLDAIWGGKWMNLTFGSTDSIKVAVHLVCDSLHVMVETKGLFGNPALVTFEKSVILTDEFSPSQDTIKLTFDSPFAGEIIIVNGHFTGDLTDPLFGFGLQFNGNFGADQVMALYTVTNNTGTVFANGYFYISNLQVIDSREAIALQLINTDSVSCEGMMDGSAEVMATGGFEPIEYQWSDGGSGAMRNDLSASTYTVIAIDHNGCTNTLELMIKTGIGPNVESVGSADVTCFGAMDGQLEVMGSGGRPPYTYLWDDNRTNALHDKLAPGEHKVTVTDAKGCQSDSAFHIDTPDLIDIDSVVITNATDGMSDGAISINVKGGIMPYTFEWTMDNTFFSNDEDLNDILAGEYILTIKDANGCMFSSDTLVVKNLTRVEEADLNFIIYPNPASTFIRIQSPTGANSLRILNLTGREILKKKISAGNETISLYGFHEGVYFMEFGKDWQKKLLKLIIINP